MRFTKIFIFSLLGMLALSQCARKDNNAMSGTHNQHHSPRAKSSVSKMDRLEKMEDIKFSLEEEAAVSEKSVDVVDPKRISENVLENTFRPAKLNPLTTFSIDVDKASYSYLRTSIQGGSLPDPNQVRVEELINYFDYNYPEPTDNHPFAVHTEVAKAPWNTEHHLVRIALQGKKPVYGNETRPSNLVFLLDVSGSMSGSLELVKNSMRILLEKMSAQDKISLVVYAGAAGLVLPATSADKKAVILDALNKLQAGGSTAGGEGINLAYKIAKENFIKEGNNRVVLCTDGDFNVGVSSDEGLLALITEKRKENVFLTVAGFGYGNFNDQMLEKISNSGDGNYFYIDNEKEARQVFGRDMHANMFAIAKDVKIQVGFNPELVKAYRLIGYENRRLENRDFNNDKKDAGELGAGHNVTAIYEIIPVGSASKQILDTKTVEKDAKNITQKDELVHINLRYKPIGSDVSTLFEHSLSSKTAVNDWKQSSESFRFASAVTAWGLLVKKSEYKANATIDMVLEIAKTAIGADTFGDRAEFLGLVEQTRELLK
jgi:Ca-activated chloride channel homolog